MRNHDSGVGSSRGESLLTLSRAAEQFGVSASGLRAAVERGTVRHRERRPYRRGELILLDEQELEADLEQLPRCATDGCERVAFHPSGFCARCVSKRQGWRGKTSPADRADRLQEVRRLHAVLAPEGRNTPGEIARRLGYSRPTIAADLESLGLTWPGKGTRPIDRPSPAEVARRRRAVARHAAAGLKPREIAEAIGWSKEVVVKDLDALGLARPGRGRRANVLPEPERSLRQARVAELYRADLSEHEIADELGISRGQVHRDLAALKVEKRSVGRPRKYPAPTELSCDVCGEPFTPRRGGTAARFCSRECQRQAHTQARADALAFRGLLSVATAAERIHVVPRAIQGAIDRDELQAEWVEVSGTSRGGCWGVSEQALKGFVRSRARERRPHCESWLNPDSVIRRLEGSGRLERLARETGLSPDEVRQLEVSRVLERARLHARHRRGRRSNPDRAKRWAEHVRCKFEELTNEYEQDVELGLADPADAPSHWLACRYVASEDWRTHPHDWSRTAYPASSSDPDSLSPSYELPAADRVLKAIKRLQTAQTK